MVDAAQISLDADKLPKAALIEQHVAQPGVQRRFTRSTLLVGTKGSGKTFLLRHRSMTSHPEAVYLNLNVIFSSISDEGIGPGSRYINEEQQHQVANKALALLFVHVLYELREERRPGLLVPKVSTIAELVPPKMRRNFASETLSDYRSAIRRIDLGHWGKFSAWPTFAQLMIDISRRLHDGLSLFLDRGDDISFAATQTLMQMLNQSLPFTTVISVRPGAHQAIPWRNDDRTLIPGDQYQVVHLGMAPRTEQWRDYLAEATNRFLRSMEAISHDVPAAQLSWSSSLARDSTRDAITFAQTGVLHPDLESRTAAMRELRTSLIGAVAETVIDFTPTFDRDIRRMLAHLTEARRQDPFFVFQFKIRELDDRIRTAGNASPKVGSILSGIRGEGYFLPHGVSWNPLELENRFELSPLITWDGENMQWLK